MKPYFLSPSMQGEFEQNGFVKLKLLNEEQCDALMMQYKLIEEEHLKLGIPFITTSHSNNYELIRKADGMISNALLAPLEKVMCNYKLLFGNFLIKMPGSDSATPAHQDSTFVDEKEYQSISIWLSLQDTDEHNGCMKFIKGSHKFRYTLRPTHFYPWPYAHVRDILEEMMESFPSKRGEAFVFSHSVIHGSHANTTNTPRVAVVLAAYPEEAQLYDFFLPINETRRVQKYKMTKDAYLAIVKGEPPSKGEYVGDVMFDFVQFDKDEFKKIIAHRPTATEKKGLLNTFISFATKLVN